MSSNDFYKNSQRGSALVYVLITAAVFGIVTGTFINWYTGMQKQKAQLDVKTTGRLLLNNIINTIESDTAWSVNKANNAMPGKLTLYMADGTPYVTQAANDGFGLDGTPCHTFNSSVGNDLCPFHYDVTVVSCAAAPLGCDGATITVAASFKPQHSAYFANFNTQNYSRGVAPQPAYVRGQTAVTLAGSCALMGGIYNSNTQFCTLATGTSTSPDPCPGGYYATGVSGVTVSCSQMVQDYNVACGPKSAFIGLNNLGQFICYKY